MMRIRSLIFAPVAVLGVLAGSLMFAGVPAQAATVRSKIGSFGPNGRDKGGFDGTPESITVEQSTGDVYVLSVNEEQEASIYKFNATGEPVDFSSTEENVIALSPGKQSGRVPHGQIVVDNSSSSLDKGDIYVASKAFEGVLIYSGSTGVELGLLTNERAEAGGVTVDSSGNLYVSNPEENIGIKKYEPSSNPITESDFTGEELKVAEEAVGDIAVDSAGDIYAAGFGEKAGVVKYKASQFGEEEPTGASVDSNTKATTLAVDPSSQDLYIDEQSDIAMYTPGGVREEEFGSGSLSTSYGVAVSDASGSVGDVYVSAGGEGSEVIIFGPPSASTEFPLKVEKEGTGAAEGKVTSSPPGIACGTGAGCEAEFEEGETVTLTATEEGATFTKWTGCETEPIPTTCEVKMTAAKTVKAEFMAVAKPKFLLEIEVKGHGEVTSTGTIKCKEGGSTGECSEGVEETNQVELKEKPETGSVFVKWSGVTCEGASITTPTCKFKMPSTATKVEAEFMVLTTSPLNVYITGSGEVKGATIACTPLDGICEEQAKGPTTLTATPAPHSGYVLAGWIGCKKTGTDTCEVDVTSASEVTAVFLLEGKEGSNGTAGPTGPPGATGAQGEKGSPGTNGTDGKNGLQGAGGAQGPAGPLGVQGPAGAQGPTGPAGQVEIVTCKTTKKNKKSVQQCTTKLVSGTVKLTTTTATSAHATLSRHGAVYAAGTAQHGTHGHMSLRLTPLRKLSPGDYTLTLINGTGSHETIQREAFTLH